MSPGHRYSHYRPVNSEMVLYTGERDAVSRAVRQAARDAEAAGRTYGIIDFEGDAERAAKGFFKELRRLDSEKVDLIIAAGVSGTGLAEAVADRMTKAAGGNIRRAL